MGRGGSGPSSPTCEQHFELPVVELHLLLGHQAALGALPDRVHEAHAGQRYLLAAALVAEAAAAAPAVVLREERDPLPNVRAAPHQPYRHIILTGGGVIKPGVLSGSCCRRWNGPFF